MERLKDGHFEPASLEADTASLLRASEPYGVPAALKRSVRVRLVEASPRRRAPLLLRVAIVAGALGIVVASMAAVNHARRKPARSPEAVQSALAPGASVGGGAVHPGLAPASDPVTDSALAAPSASGVLEVPKRAALDGHRDAHTDSSAPSEASLVYETAHALRNEGDLARAARTSDDYFKRYPHGALEEEALALAIDIAVARGDARARSLASHYLAEYPAGHFRLKAQRVLGASP